MSLFPKFCGECGASLSEGMRFCGECGARITGFQDSNQDEAGRKTTSPPPQSPEPKTSPTVPPGQPPSNRDKPQDTTVNSGSNDSETPPLPDHKENKKSRMGRPLFGVLVLLLIIVLVTGGYGGAIFLAQEISPGYVGALAFSPDDKKLATAGPDKELQLWDLDSGTTISRAEIGPGIVKALAWAHDNKFLALAVRSEIHIYQASNLNRFSAIPIGDDEIRALCFDTDGSTLYSVTNRLGLSVWDFQQGERLGGIPDLPDKVISEVAFSGDCKRIVSFDNFNTQPMAAVYQRINMETLREIPFEGIYDEPQLVGLNPNGALVLGINDSRVRTWEVNTGKTAEVALRQLYPTALGIGNKNRVAIGGITGLVNLYDVRGKYLFSLQHGTSLGLALLPLID